MTEGSSESCAEMRSTSSQLPKGKLPSTRWTLIRLANSDKEAEAANAKREICETYWFPIYSFVRKSGLDHHDSQDRTQAFLQQVLQSETLARAANEKGRFRSYLLGAVVNFLKNSYRNANTLKRGGAVEIFSIDAEVAESQYAVEARGERTPEEQFERAWGMALLQRVGDQLRTEYEAAGREEIFAELAPLLSERGVKGTRYEEIGKRLKLSASGVGVSLFRMRKRFKELLRAEIGQTVESEEAIDEEIAYLKQVFAE